jgi:integrase
VIKLIDYAIADKEREILNAFPYLTGCRCAEQLGLLWQDVNFETGFVSIQRVQETTTDTTKTEAGKALKKITNLSPISITFSVYIAEL